MALDYQTFVEKHPEFRKAPAPSVVEEAIAAEDRFVSDSWTPEERRDDYVALRTADALAHSPAGRNARLVDPKTGVSVYAHRIMRYNKIHAMARSRTGSCG